MAQQFTLPDLGEGITEAQIIKVLVKEGETIAEDQGLFEVETDKAAVEIPSPFAGVATKVHVKEGQTVNVGAVLISFDGNGSATAQKSAAAAVQQPPAKAAPPVAAKPTPTPTIAPAASAPVAASSSKRTSAPAAPAVRKLAREMGVDIDALDGSGPGGRVTREDVESAASGGGRPAAAGQPAAMARVAREMSIPTPPGVQDADKWGSVRRSPLSQIRKTIANQMVKSAFTIPHVTHIDQADISELERVRKEFNESTGSRVTAMAFLIRVVATALKRHPVFNASLDLEKGEIIYKDYVNIGVAVDTERGLVVPNVRDADGLSVTQIVAALAKIAESARTMQFAIEDLRGGTFTLTNVGALGGMFSTPIINHPEVAILGVGRAKETPVVRGGQIVVRTMMPLNLSFDHRIADGAQAARFCGDVIRFLENPVTMLF
ncbi:MAG: 2-oxo acid dehydrogenase subunit E2 [Phycisphaerales bacterium]|nr:2-oxo acid dehydrogenase subunit E2 [Phycisphaerales bacterium]